MWAHAGSRSAIHIRMRRKFDQVAFGGLRLPHTHTHTNHCFKPPDTLLSTCVSWPGPVLCIKSPGAVSVKNLEECLRLRLETTGALRHIHSTRRKTQSSTALVMVHHGACSLCQQSYHATGTCRQLFPYAHTRAPHLPLLPPKLFLSKKISTKESWLCKAVADPD